MPEFLLQTPVNQSFSNLNPNLQQQTNNLSAGADHSCLINPKTHRVHCWGDNSLRQLDLKRAAEKRYLFVAAGGAHSCAVTLSESRQLVCWGLNQSGQADVQSGDQQGVIQVAGGADNTCVIRETEYGSQGVTGSAGGAGGEAGNRNEGLGQRVDGKGGFNGFINDEDGASKGLDQINVQFSLDRKIHKKKSDDLNNEKCSKNIDSDMKKNNGDNIEKFDSSNDINMINNNASDTDFNDQIMKKIFQQTNDESLIKNKISDDINYISTKYSIQDPEFHDENINNLTILSCFGCNFHNQTQVPTILKYNVIKVDSGGFHTCLIKYLSPKLLNLTNYNNNTKNQLGCFGSNTFGQSEVPLRVRHNSKFISTGLFHTCVIQKWHLLHCFGKSAVFNTALLSAEQSHPNLHFTQQFLWQPLTIAVSAGALNSCVINQFGWVECWGNDRFGILEVPGAVSGQAGGGRGEVRGRDAEGKSLVHSVVLGAEHACALRQGVVRPVCWGSNRKRQLDTPKG